MHRESTFHKRYVDYLGFTLVEIIIIIIILGVLAVVATPRLIDLTRSAKIATLQGIARTMQSTIEQSRAKALINGLTPASQNPGNQQQQSFYIVDFGFGTTEIDWRNLCPESEGELGTGLTMLDFIDMTGDITAQTNNQYTLVGYNIPGFSVPTNQGCYIIYDSFGDPDCTVTLVDVDC